MDVAQALAAQSTFSSEHKMSPQEPPSPKPQAPIQEEEADEAYSPPDVKAMAANWGHGGARPSTNGPARSPSSELRKSSYERYSAIAMPTLEEERTPVPSPAGTLARSAALVVPDIISEAEVEVALAAEAEVAVAVTDVVEESLKPAPPAPAESKVVHVGS